MPSQDILRRVGRLEKYSTTRHDLGFYTNVAVTANYTLPHHDQLSLQDQIYKACAILIVEHPSLSVNVVNGETTSPSFVRLTQINLEKCVLFRSVSTPFKTDHGIPDRDLDEILETQHNLGFQKDEPLWRLVVWSDTLATTSFTAVFVFHHAIGDGASGLAFHRQLLAAICNGYDSGSVDTVQTIVASPTKSLPPTVEESLPLSISWSHFLRVILDGLIWKRFEKGFWYGDVIQKPLVTNIRQTGLTKPISEAFRALCRQNSTSITAALQTLIAEIILESMPSDCTSIRSNGAMSLRSFISAVDENSMGTWVTAWDEIYRKSEASKDGLSWQRARKSKKAIDFAVAARGNDSPVGLLQYVPDYQKYLTGKLGQQRDATFELSNLGACRCTERSNNDTPVPERPRIGRMVFSQSGNVSGPALAVSSVTGGDGCLSLAFSWQTGVLREDLVLDVIGKLRSRINTLVPLTDDMSLNDENLYV